MIGQKRPLQQADPQAVSLHLLPSSLPHRRMARRRPIREVGIKRRHGAMTAGEVLNERQTLESVMSLLTLAEEEDDAEEKEDTMLFSAMAVAHLEEERIDHTVVESVRGRGVCPGDVGEARAWHDFRCRKEHLPRLFAALRFPDVFVCKNNSRFPGETANLLLLHRLR